MERAAHKRRLRGDGKLDVKTFREIEGAGDGLINRPTAIEQCAALAPLKRHSAIVL
jgi:hypothetical protein